MDSTTNLTEGSVTRKLIGFALPFLIAAALQSMYGAVDLFVVGHFSGTHAIAAVNLGSQIMYVITTFVMGMAQGITVELGQFIGADSPKGIKNTLRVGIILLVLMAAVLTPVMVALPEWLAEVLDTPAEAAEETAVYIRICSIAIPFLVLFNGTAAIFRGLGDSRTPMWVVGVACVVNVALDFILTGVMGYGVLGVAVATSAAQAVSSVVSAVLLAVKLRPFRKMKTDDAADSGKKSSSCGSILKMIVFVGLPAALQDTLMTIAFVLITKIANGRGLEASSAVGVVEKLAMIMFLLPGAFLAADAAVTAQNIGAGKIDRAVRSLKVSILITASVGFVCFVLCLVIPVQLASIFTEDPEVMVLAKQYLTCYSADMFLAAFTFCLNGFLCGMEKSIIVFIHNTIAIFAVRVPVAYFLSNAFPDTMTPMGCSSPAGSAASLLILAGYFLIAKPVKHLRQKNEQLTGGNNT